MDDNNVGVGCAIFISPTVAVTCFHNVEGHQGEVIPGMLEDGTRVNFKVREPSTDDKALDIVSLEVHGEDARPVKHFLPLSMTALFRGQPAVVLSFQVAIQEELENSFSLGVGFVTSTVFKASKHHVLLQTATFRGDSGAAVVLADGKLIAMNVAGINAARERLKHWEDVEEDEGVKLRLTDVKASVDSLVGDLAQGSLAVRSSAFAHFLA
jgi:S1-C subfamily serine protease